MTDADDAFRVGACWHCGQSWQACEARRVRQEQPCCDDCRHRDPLTEPEHSSQDG